MGSAGPYRWEFDQGTESLTVDVHGALVVDDMDVTIRAAMDGIGLAFSLEEYVAPHLASGALVRVLEDWCSPFAGFFLYYPSRRQQPAAWSALIDTLRLEDRRKWAGDIRRSGTQQRGSGKGGTRLGTASDRAAVLRGTR
jgi:DNA-binding transcriptional LysR family regulator